MIFDAAAIGGNLAMDLFGASSSEVAPPAQVPIALVIKMPAEAIESAEALPAEPPPVEPAVEEEEFFSVFAGAESASTFEVGPEEHTTEEKSEEPVPMPKTANEPVASETLRVIFPVHYFYTEIQIREASVTEDPQAETQAAPQVEPSRLARLSESAVPTRPEGVPLEPIEAVGPEHEAARPEGFFVPPEEPTEAMPVQNEHKNLRATVDATEVPRPRLEPQRDGVVEPEVERVSAKTEPFVPAPAAALAVNPPTAPPRESETPVKGIPVQEVPQAVPKVVAAVRREQANGQDSTPQDQPEPKPAPIDSSKGRPSPEPSNQPKFQAPSKVERRERSNFSPKTEEKAIRPEAPEPAAPRNFVAEPKTTVDNPPARSEPSAPVQPPTRISGEPASAVAPARSVSIAVVGPQGEDVRAIVQSTSEGVQVRLQAGDERTQQALQWGAPELRQRLEESQRTSSGDVWESVHHASETIADIQSPNADFGGQNDSSQRESTASQEDASSGQRHGQRGFGRGQQNRDAESAEEDFAVHFEQGGRS